MKKEITWQLRNGKEAKVTVELITKKTIDADGDLVTVPCCELVITAQVAGHGVVGTGRPVDFRPAGDPAIVAKIGDLAMTADTYTKIMAAIAEAEQTPEWQAHLERLAKAEGEVKKYEAHRETMRKIMGY